VRIDTITHLTTVNATGAGPSPDHTDLPVIDLFPIWDKIDHALDRLALPRLRCRGIALGKVEPRGVDGSDGDSAA